MKESARRGSLEKTHIPEANWEQTDDFYLKAMMTGKTEISVKIMEKGYEKVPEAKISLQIVDPFIILPDLKPEEKEDLDNDPRTHDHPIRIFPNSEFPLKLALVQKNEEQELYTSDIKIPSDQYNWTPL